MRATLNPYPEPAQCPQQHRHSGHFHEINPDRIEDTPTVHIQQEAFPGNFARQVLRYLFQDCGGGFVLV
jgi:hypothetical protein